jgi:hypothetical protein
MNFFMTLRGLRFSKRFCDDNTVLSTNIIVPLVFEENALRLSEVGISKGDFSVHVRLV